MSDLPLPQQLLIALKAMLYVQDHDRDLSAGAHEAARDYAREVIDLAEGRKPLKTPKLNGIPEGHPGQTGKPLGLLTSIRDSFIPVAPFASDYVEPEDRETYFRNGNPHRDPEAITLDGAKFAKVTWMVQAYLPVDQVDHAQSASIAEIGYQLNDGDSWIGNIDVVSVDGISDHLLRDRLLAIGNDGEFFNFYLGIEDRGENYALFFDGNQKWLGVTENGVPTPRFYDTETDAIAAAERGDT